MEVENYIHMVEIVVVDICWVEKMNGVVKYVYMLGKMERVLVYTPREVENSYKAKEEVPYTHRVGYMTCKVMEVAHSHVVWVEVNTM